YSATTSSLRVRWKRKANGDFRTSKARATTAILRIRGRGPLRILDVVKTAASDGVYAKRILDGRDDTGGDERIVVWIERRPGAVWAVGRTVNQHLRAAPEPHAEDYLFVGYE